MKKIIEYKGRQVEVKSSVELTDEQVVKFTETIVGLLAKECDLCHAEMDPTDVALVPAKGLLRKKDTVGMTIEWVCPECGSRYLAVFPRSALERKPVEAVLEDVTNDGH